MRTMYDKNDLANIAYDNGLRVIETTTNYNGYPEGLKDAIVGFDNFNQAKELAREYGLTICTFFKKDGWALWYRNGNITYNPIEPNAEDFGDYYKEYYSDDYNNLEDFYKKETYYYIQENVSELSLMDLEDSINRTKKLYEELETIDSDEVLISDGYTSYTFKKEAMDYYYDTKSYIIGLINL
jgi:hypothetical protein